MSVNEDARKEAMENIPSRKTAIGLDVGTYTLVSARRGVGGDIVFRKEVNGFFTLKITPSTRKMLQMVKASKAPMYEPPGKDIAYILGEQARNIAYSWSSVLGNGNNEHEAFCRTMRDGIISVKDSKQSFNVLALMLRSIVSPLDADNIPICFSIPGSPIDRNDLSPEYHERSISDMLSKIGDRRTDPFSCNEAAAIIEAEAAEDGYTALAISCGAGMTNVCFTMSGIPVFSFSLVGGGDWIDRSVAKATGVESVVANQIKMGVEGEMEGIDLLRPSSGENEHIERSIKTHYGILIDKVVQGVERFVNEKNVKVMPGTKPSVIVAGGTASPNGFTEMLRDRFAKANLGSFKIGEVRRAENNLYTVAKGLLLQAENADRNL